MNFPAPPPPLAPTAPTALSVHDPLQNQNPLPHQPQPSPQSQHQSQLLQQQQQQPRPTPPHQSANNPTSNNRQQQPHVAQLSQYAQAEAAQRAAAEAQAAATSRSIQAQHQHIQLQNLLALQGGQVVAMNGMNGAGPAMQSGGVNAGSAMAVGPTPAGHQAELNVIYGMVEELSRQLADNRRQTEDIVNGLGRVRNRARERGLGNEDVLGEAADEIYGQEPNLEALLSVLSEALDRAKNSRDANLSLLTSYARVLSSLLNQFHSYKQKHISDVSAWHRSYRSQLAEARAENSRLREQIWEMQDHAGQANKMLREFRKKYDEDEGRMDRRIEDKAKKQEIRFWKRMAMPELTDGDMAAWSDDDDIVDPMEKERLREVEWKAAEQATGLGSTDSQQGEDSEDEDGSVGQGHQGMGIFGGVAMEREGSMPIPPPRPASTGSTGGQTG